MNKIISRIAVVAAAVTTFASCQMEIADLSTETLSVNLNLNADVEQTKTYLGENNTVLWGKDESVMLYLQDGDVKVEDEVAVQVPKFIPSTATSDYNEKASAQFTFTIVNIVPASEYTLGGIYPASAAIKDNKKAEAYKIALSATQNQIDGKYDPSAYIMVLKPEVVTEVPTEYTASFRRAVALNKITLTGVEEDILSVEITIPEDKYLAGRRFVDLTTAEFGEIYYDQSSSIVVNSVFTGNTIDVWFTSWGVDLAQGDEMTIKMTSATKTYTRTITVREEGIKFVEGDLNKLTVNMSDATVETLDDFSGEYLIVNTDLTRAAQAWNNGNNLPEFELNARDGVIYESEGIEKCKMTIELQADGKYTIKDANGLYLYAASSSSNHLKGKEEASSWTIEQDGNKYILTSSAQTSRNIMRYNENNKIFSCYSSDQKDITLYKYSDIKVDTTPSISLAKNSDQVTCDATSYEFTYTVKNITGNVAATIKDEATMTNVSASASNGIVTVKFDANADAEQKTATIVLSYEGAVSQDFVLTQAGKPAAGTVVDVLTRATTGVTSTNYTDWSGKQVTSSAVYAGNSAGGNDAIQLRSNNNNSGVVTTKSGGKVKKIKVTWQSSTSSGRTLDIYGKNTAYSAATDLYNSSNQGTKLGSIKCGTSTELVISGDYEFIGLRSNSGAMYLTEIEITWDTSGSGGEVIPDPEPDPTPDPEPEQPGSGESIVDFSFTSANSVTTEDVTVTFSKGSGQNPPAWTSSQLRLYARNTIVVSSSTKNITKIEYVFTKQGSKDYATASGPATYTSGGNSTGSTNPVTDVWTGSSNSVTVTLGSSGQRVLKSIKVYCN